MASVPTSDDPSQSVVAFPDFRLFDSAQDILDHNKRIIKEIKTNHEAQTPEALARNCLLIRELNTNIGAVMQAYRSISESFERYMTQQPTAVQQQRGFPGGQQQQQQQQQVGGDATGNGNASEAAAAVPQMPA